MLVLKADRTSNDKVFCNNSMSISCVEPKQKSRKYKNIKFKSSVLLLNIRAIKKSTFLISSIKKAYNYLR